MRTFIKDKLITTSTPKLVITAIAFTLLLSIILTTITSFIMLGKFSVELFWANVVIGIVIPAIVAPFMINIIKQATNWEQINQELKQENIARKKLEQEATQKATAMRAINNLAIECATAKPDVDITKLIAEKLRDITNALGVGITVYDPTTRTLTTKHIAVSGQLLSAANKIVGRNLIGMVNPVDPGMEKHMLQGMVESFSDLSEVTFGLIPKPVATTIKNTLGIGKFTGMALTHGGSLIGTAIIVQREEQPDLDPEVCKTLAHVSAVSIQRRKVEEILIESENKLRAIIENLSEGLLLSNEKGQVIEWNPTMEALTGLEKDATIGQFVWDIQHKLTPIERQDKTTYQVIKEMTEKIIKTGNLKSFDKPFDGIIHSHKNEVKHIRQTLFSVPTENGYRIGTVMHDITSRKQIEKDRDRLITELKAKNTELEKFTYTVSHDLKAPLITIKGFLGLLEKDAFSGDVERTQTDIKRINEAVDKMHQLLSELLELSRIGRIINPSQSVPLESIVQDAIAAVHGTLKDKDVKVDITPSLPTVWVDRIRIMQVLQNVLDNAAKFMGQQANPHIEIGTTGIDKDGNTTIFIKDNGLGIEPDHLDKVFELFQKLDASAKGTGVGLALVKRIVEVHGGKVWIQSDGLNQGTTVFFTLPTDTAEKRSATQPLSQ